MQAFGWFLAALFAGIGGMAQISPGELSKVHSHLEGISNCTKCHILGKKVSNEKCLDCHTELKARIDLKKGYHVSTEVRGKECITCHSDHHGLNFQIVRFEKEKFNHNLAGFELTGAHAKQPCIACHKTGFIKDQQIRKKKFTYLGLNPACLGCHEDYHQKTLSATCTDCHGQDAFRPASKFDHERARFRLAGMHQQAACTTCHKVTTKNGKKYQEFKGLRFDNCVACHQDPHNNKFGRNCAQCHTETSFKTIKGTGNFNHDRTNFKLEGKHRTVACTSCHKTRLTGALKYSRCTDCHTDYHKGQFIKQGVAPDCAQCHTVNGFPGFNYTIDQHNAGTFPLKGAHLATPCIACHLRQAPQGDTTWKFRGIGSHCADCHENIHIQAMREKYSSGGCDQCHNEGRWSVVSFDHGRTLFQLTGAHTTVACRSCHFRTKGSGPVRQEFSGLSMTCSRCHIDIHQQQFTVGDQTDCSRCHDAAKFKPATKFNHAATRFPLDGKHKDLPCGKCHKVIQKNEITFVLYKIKDFKCEDCHH